jgi:bifunctional DNA-binding transcriptional regulator/antitoxin component of YhaV-PrlF toxin-antitoxin module
MSTTLTVDASGTLTLPADLCRAAGAAPGTDVVADVRNGQVVVAPARPSLTQWIAGLAADAPPEELDKLPVDGASTARPLPVRDAEAGQCRRKPTRVTA